MSETEKKIKELFSEPRIMAVTGDFNSGKSNLIKYIINVLNNKYKYSLYTYGLENSNFNDTKINSVEELEGITNSVIVIDEFFSLFDLEDRKKRKLIEKTIRLIFHNNNILLICGLPENFKKFIASKLHIIFYLKSTLYDFINGSKIKNICLSYKGIEMGSSVLSLKKNECIVYDGHYIKYHIPYMEKMDYKKDFPDILESKSPEKSGKSVQKKVQNGQKRNG